MDCRDLATKSVTHAHTFKILIKSARSFCCKIYIHRSYMGDHAQLHHIMGPWPSVLLLIKSLLVEKKTVLVIGKILASSSHTSTPCFSLVRLSTILLRENDHFFISYLQLAYCHATAAGLRFLRAYLQSSKRQSLLMVLNLSSSLRFETEECLVTRTLN